MFDQKLTVTSLKLIEEKPIEDRCLQLGTLFADWETVGGIPQLRPLTLNFVGNDYGPKRAFMAAEDWLSNESLWPSGDFKPTFPLGVRIDSDVAESNVKTIFDILYGFLGLTIGTRRPVIENDDDLRWCSTNSGTKAAANVVTLATL